MSTSVASRYLSLEAAERVEHEPRAIKVSRGSSARGPRDVGEVVPPEGGGRQQLRPAAKEVGEQAKATMSAEGRCLVLSTPVGKAWWEGNESVSARTASVRVCGQELWRAWRRWSG